MTLLNSVTVGGYPYALEWLDAAPQQENGAVCGEIDYYGLKISISKGQHPLAERATVLHELIHAIAQHSGHSELRENENHIEALSYVLLTMLRSNPDLVRYLTE